MIETITSTEIKQNTKAAIDKVSRNSALDMLIYTHNQPRAILIGYERWLKLTQKANNEPSLWDKYKDKVIRSKKRVDSTKLIRKQRDAR